MAKLRTEITKINAVCEAMSYLCGHAISFTLSEKTDDKYGHYYDLWVDGSNTTIKTNDKQLKDYDVLRVTLDRLSWMKSTGVI